MLCKSDAMLTSSLQLKQYYLDPTAIAAVNAVNSTNNSLKPSKLIPSRAELLPFRGANNPSVFPIHSHLQASQALKQFKR